MKLDRATHREIIDLLTPLVSDSPKQTALVTAAFFGSTLLNQINTGMTARDFAVHLVSACIDYGVLEDDEPALLALLDEMRVRVGKENQQSIEVIIHRLKYDDSTKYAKPQTGILTTTTVMQIDTVTMLHYFYNAQKDKDWERANRVLSVLAERDDLPRYFGLRQHQESVRAKLKVESQRSRAEQDYSVLRVMAVHEAPEVVWSALLKFWQAYPKYDPDNLRRIGRELEYGRLRELAVQRQADKLWTALNYFWEMFPEYDPDNLADIAQKMNTEGYQEALRRIEHAYYHHQSTLQLNNLNLRTIPPEIVYLSGLQELSLANNDIGKFPEIILELTNLKRLSLSGNHLISLPPGIGALNSLTSLRLNQNQITYLPTSISELKNVERLFLNANHLTTLPGEIGALSALNVLDLGKNHIQSLPSTLVNLHHLQWLFLNENDLQHLPDVIHKLKHLNWLSLHNNQLVALPPEIGEMRSLRWLSVTHNNLLMLPLELGKVNSLEYLAATSGNSLSRIPFSIVRQGDGGILRWLREQQHTAVK